MLSFVGTIVQKLSEEKVREAARLHCMGASYRALAKEFDRDVSTIHQHWRKSPYWDDEVKRAITAKNLESA